MKMTIKTPLNGGAINAISSKSQAHRLLIAAGLSSSPTEIACSVTSADIDATADCLRALGAEIDYSNGVFTVDPIKRPVVGERILDCGESGSTLRFILPICCALGVDTALHMSGRLPNRPLTPLYEELISHGCALSPLGQNPLHTSGHLTGDTYTIPGNISSQFISGLLLALPLLDTFSMIKVSGDIESKPYIDMTLAVLKSFGVTVRFGDKRFCCYRLDGKQRYLTPGRVVVEGDWSNAAFWLCAGALTSQSITVTNLDRTSLQGDMAVLTHLQRFGARVDYGSGSVTVSRAELKGIDIDAGDTPDLVPILAAIAAVSSGKTVIYNAERLRIKESDRLKTVTETLTALGADIAETADGLVINGKARLLGGTVCAHGDHRIAMMAAIVSTACENAVTIEDAEAVNKSYPGFFKDFCALGGIVEEEI